jgi:hypothetical protein
MSVVFGIIAIGGELLVFLGLILYYFKLTWYKEYAKDLKTVEEKDLSLEQVRVFLDHMIIALGILNQYGKKREEKLKERADYVEILTKLKELNSVSAIKIALKQLKLPNWMVIYPITWNFQDIGVSMMFLGGFIAFFCWVISIGG